MSSMRKHLFTKYVAGVELRYICDNYKPFSKDYDEKCIGWNIKDKPIALIQRTYY